MTKRIMRNIDPGFKWYDVDSQGRVRLESNIRTRDKGNPLSPCATVALALTQVCSERLKGRVYCMYNDVAPEASDDPDGFAMHSRRTAPPGLFYVLEFWTAQEREEWKSMAPLKQLDRCWAGHGWVHPSTVVLPFQAITHLHGHDQRQRLIKPQFMAQTTAPVLVWITGDQLFVGPTEAMKGKCSRDQKTSGKGEPVADDYVASDWTSFGDWKMAELTDLLDDLDRMFVEQCDLLSDYSHVLQQVQRGFRQALPAESHLKQAQAQAKKKKQSDKRAKGNRSAALYRDMMSRARSAWSEGGSASTCQSGGSTPKIDSD